MSNSSSPSASEAAEKEPSASEVSSPEVTNPALAAYYSNSSLMWRNLGLILLLNLGWAVSFAVIGPLITLRVNNAGLGEQWIGFIQGANGWAYSFLVMYFAWKSDHTVSRFGRRIPYLFLTAPFIIVAVILIPFTEWKWALAGLWLMQMLFTDIKAATIPLLNIDCMPRRLLARTAAPAVALTGILNFMAMRYGMKLTHVAEYLPFIIGASILFCTTLIGGFLIKEPPITKPTKEKFRPWSTMKVAWRDRRTVILMIAVSLFQTFQSVFYVWTWLYAKNTLHLTRVETAHAMSWCILVSITAAYPAGWLIDRVSPYKLLPCFCILMGVALVAMLNVTGIGGLILASSIIALTAPLYGAADIMVYRKADPTEIGSVTSTNSCLRGIYNGCMALIVGSLITSTGGNYQVGFTIAYVLTILGLIPLFTFRWMTTNRSKPASACTVGSEASAGC